jgi:hypothetical protein
MSSMNAQTRYRTLVSHLAKVYAADETARTTALHEGLDEIVEKIQPVGAESWQQVKADTRRLLRVWMARETRPGEAELASQILDALEEYAELPSLVISTPAPAPMPAAPAPTPIMKPAPAVVEMPAAPISAPVVAAPKPIAAPAPAPAPATVVAAPKPVVSPPASTVKVAEPVAAPTPSPVTKSVPAPVEEEGEADEDDVTEEEVEQEEEEEEQEEVVEPEAAEEEEADKGDAATEEEEEEQAEEAEEEEEPEGVLKKVFRGRTYWMGETSGTLYTYHGDEEDVGEEVGKVVDGRAVFLTATVGK